MSKLTGATVRISIKNSDSKRVVSYDSKPVLKRSVRLQAGEPCVFKIHKSVDTTSMTPSKRHSRELRINTTPSSTYVSNESTRRISPLLSTTIVTPTNQVIGNISPAIKFLPGVKVTTKKQLPCKNRCEVCRTIYQSKEDKKAGKMYRRQNQWLGCDQDGCDYWVHARCGGIKLSGKASNIEFFCPEHK